MPSESKPGRPHVLLVSYLFLPSNRSGARRTAALRNALEELGVRTTVLTSTVSGASSDDDRRSVARARDARSLGVLQPVVGSNRRRWWSRLVTPDITAVSWAPAAAASARRILVHDRPDAVLTSSPPESVHLLGLLLRARGVPWIADFRDGWTFEPPTLRPYLTGLDRTLEQLVLARADRLTAVTAPLADHLRTRASDDGRVVHLTNGFDPALAAAATDEKATLDPGRFSVVYTGTGAVDGKDLRPFLRALRTVLGERPGLSDRLEVVFAGDFTAPEIAAMGAEPVRAVVRTLGHVPHLRALGLQQAADGLLLITPTDRRHVATLKIYEYLAARKPILGLADGNAAAALLGARGPHSLAAPDDDDGIADALRTYLDRWEARGERFESSFDLGPFTFPGIARRLCDLFAEIGAFQRLPE